MEDYIRKNKKDKLIIMIFGIVFLLASLASLFQKIFLIGFGLFLCSLVLLYNSFFGKAEEDKYLIDLKRQGTYDEIEKDFNIACSFADDQIRCGEKYIFRNKLYKIISFEEVESIEYFERLDSNNYYEREIGMHLSNKKYEPLCSINNSLSDAYTIFDVFKKHGIETRGL